MLARLHSATPIIVSRYAGSYGWKAVYFHTFKFVELAPGEFVPTFTVGDYLQAFHSDVRNILNNNLVAYAVIGSVGIKATRTADAALTPRAGLDCPLVAYPNFEFRYYSLFYILVAISVCGRPSVALPGPVQRCKAGQQKYG